MNMSTEVLKYETEIILMKLQEVRNYKLRKLMFSKGFH